MGDDATSPILKEHDYSDIKDLIEDIQLDLEQAINPGVYVEDEDEFYEEDLDDLFSN